MREDDWNKPITMYGCNKLYCEHLGRYYAKHYKQLLETQARQRRFSLRAVSRLDFGGHGARRAGRPTTRLR